MRMSPTAETHNYPSSPYNSTECRGGRIVPVCWGCGRETTSRLVLWDDHEVHICTPLCAGTLRYTVDE